MHLEYSKGIVHLHLSLDEPMRLDMTKTYDTFTDKQT
jgi:hypothetical protein